MGMGFDSTELVDVDIRINIPLSPIKKIERYCSDLFCNKRPLASATYVVIFGTYGYITYISKQEHINLSIIGFNSVDDFIEAVNGILTQDEIDFLNSLDNLG